MFRARGTEKSEIEWVRFEIGKMLIPNNNNALDFIALSYKTIHSPSVFSSAFSATAV